MCVDNTRRSALGAPTVRMQNKKVWKRAALRPNRAGHAAAAAVVRGPKKGSATSSGSGCMGRTNGPPRGATPNIFGLRPQPQQIMNIASRPSLGKGV